RKWDLGDDIAPEPVDATLLGQPVHGCRVDTRVDRTAHQHHRVRHVRIAGCFHHRDGGNHRHRGLADGDHVRVATEDVQHRHNVVDVIIEIEAAIGDRHRTGVLPFGDIDVVI